MFRGTELSRENAWEKTDIGDVSTNIQIATRNMPIKQIEDLLDFIENNITSEDMVTFTGHSLGGFLTQIVSVLYQEHLKTGYVFNAPGAWGYEFEVEKMNKKYRQRLSNFRVENYRESFFYYHIINYDSKKDRIGNHAGDIGRGITIPNESHYISDTETSLQSGISGSVENQTYGEIYAYKQALKVKKILEFEKPLKKSFF